MEPADWAFVPRQPISSPCWTPWSPAPHASAEPTMRRCSSMTGKASEILQILKRKIWTDECRALWHEGGIFSISSTTRRGTESFFLGMMMADSTSDIRIQDLITSHIDSLLSCTTSTKHHSRFRVAFTTVERRRAKLVLNQTITEP